MKKPRVLIADDDKFTQFQVLNALENYDISTICCYTAEEAIELLKAINFEVLLLDVRFVDDKLDGIDVALAGKKEKYEPTIVMVSGSDTEDIKERCNKSGFEADAYVSKSSMKEQFKPIFEKFKRIKNEQLIER